MKDWIKYICAVDIITFATGSIAWQARSTSSSVIWKLLLFFTCSLRSCKLILPLLQSSIWPNKGTNTMKSYLWGTESLKKVKPKLYLPTASQGELHKQCTNKSIVRTQINQSITSHHQTVQNLALVVLSVQFIIHQWTQYDSPINLFWNEHSPTQPYTCTRQDCYGIVPTTTSS